MRKWSRLLFVLYILTVLTLLIIPTDKTGIKLDKYFLGIRTDHYIHALLFAPFMVFCRLLFDPKKFLLFLFIGIAFCSFCESLHYFIPYRQFSITDFYANCCGMLIGSLIFRLRYFSRL